MTLADHVNVSTKTYEGLFRRSDRLTCLVTVTCIIDLNPKHHTMHFEALSMQAAVKM